MFGVVSPAAMAAAACLIPGAAAGCARARPGRRTISLPIGGEGGTLRNGQLGSHQRQAVIVVVVGVAVVVVDGLEGCAAADGNGCEGVHAAAPRGAGA